LAWSKLNGENQVCKADDCAREGCPLHFARRRAELAHLVVVNHSLLLADVATGGLVLPEYQDLIIDEAHHLEAAVTDALSFRGDKRGIETVMEEVLRPRVGTVANAQQRVAAAAPAEIARSVDEYADRMRREAQVANDQLEEFFALLSDFLKTQIQGRSQFTEQVRLTPAVRVQPGYGFVEESWANLSRSLKLLAESLLKMSAAIEDVGQAYDLEDGEDLEAALQNLGSDLAEIRANLDATLLHPSADYIYWAEMASGIGWERVSLHAAPLHVGPLVAEHIWQAKEAVVLTSATMRTTAPGDRGATFTYLRHRLHAEDANELAVGSPFDYKNSTLLYLVTDIPEPNQPGYQKALEEAIIEVAVALGGRTMVLFTANNHLSQTAQAIEKALARHEISTLAQTSGSSRQQLMEEFKQVESRSVLLGTRSFWEGVDVPGVALQALLIARLPFDVPSDPIFAARSETFDNPFFEYSVPEAVLRFRQGFGRLIRRQSDEGIVVVLDKRLLTKRYGQLFLDALPECTVLRQRKDRLGELALRWLNRRR
jgi:DNA polymerase-3 subunit epsilon/ATP-dependent DNA helicase DinG